MSSQPRGALPPAMLRRHYPHCIRRAVPDGGFDDLNRLHTWLRTSGHQCRTRMERIGDADHVSWCFASEAEARDFMLEFGGTPWTDRPETGGDAVPLPAREPRPR